MRREFEKVAAGGCTVCRSPLSGAAMVKDHALCWVCNRLRLSVSLDVDCLPNPLLKDEE